MPLKLLFLFLALFALFAYTCVRLTRLTHLKKREKYLVWSIVAGLFFLSMGWQFIYRYNSDLETPWLQSFYWISAVSLGGLATFLLLVIPFDLLVLFKKILSWPLKFFSKKKKKESINYERRRFISGGITLGLVGVSGGITSLGVREAMEGPLVKEINLPLQNLPKDLENFRIVQLSDLHVGPNIRRDSVESVVSKVNELRPDLIAITGDLGDGYISSLRHHLAPLGQMKSRFGNFFVTGNHEYYWNANDYIKEVEKLNIMPLLNNNEVLTVNKTKLLIGGVTDPIGHSFIRSHRHDPHKALKNPTSTALKVLLAHRPNSCYEAQKAGFDLQLSGHTHGGQFFPWSLLLPLVYEYYKGLNQHQKMWLYINSGTGFWGPPHRFLIPGEISLINLTKA